MAVTCHVNIEGEGNASERGRTWQLAFEEVPRVGEFVSFSRDGKRDELGVLYGDLFKVKHVIHVAGSDTMAPTVCLDVVVERYANQS